MADVKTTVLEPLVLEVRAELSGEYGDTLQNFEGLCYDASQRFVELAAT